MAGFLDRLFINVHVDAIDTDYGNWPDVWGKVKWLNASGIRCNFYFDATNLAKLEEAGANGLKLCAIIMGDPAPAWAALSLLAAKGYLAAIEGPNEVNVTVGNKQGPHYPGVADGYPAAVAIMAAIKRLAVADPHMAGVKIISPSLAPGGDPSGLVAAGVSADYGNAHPYMSQAAQPHLGVQVMMAAGGLLAPGKPVAATEFGYRSLVKAGSSVDEITQGRLWLSTVFDLYRMGAPFIIPYQLFDAVYDPLAANDGSDPDPSKRPNFEAHWGLFKHPTATPAGATYREAVKVGGYAFYNMGQVLADADPLTGTLNVTLTQQPVSTGLVAFNRRAGGHYVVVWAEPQIWDDVNHKRIDIKPTTATLHLDKIYSEVTVTNLITNAVTKLQDVSSVPLPIAADHLVVTLPPA